MINLPYFNINGNNEYQYSYLLHILVRITRLVEKQKITKVDFIEVCVKWGVSKRTAYRIWEEGAYKNQFIKYVSDNSTYLYITGKDQFETIIEKVPEYIYKKITGINSLKDFLHYAFLGNNGVTSEGKTTGKGLNAIAQQTNTTIQTVCNKNKKCIEKFGLEKTNRYGVYNNFVIRLTNTYKSAIRIVNNKYCAVKGEVKKGLKIVSDKLAPLFNILNSKIDKKLAFLPKEYYQTVNSLLYPKLIQYDSNI